VESKKRGRPAKDGTTVKTNLGTTWYQLLTDIVERMKTFTSRDHNLRDAGLTLPGSDHRAWDRSSIIEVLIIAAAPQFAETVLGIKQSVKPRYPCPLCWGYVDGPHTPACGYFGPLAEHDPNFDNRLRAAIRRAAGRSRFSVIDGNVAEVWTSPQPADPAPDRN
jgi:hypothetical protein